VQPCRALRKRTADSGSRQRRGGRKTAPAQPGADFLISNKGMRDYWNSD